MGRNDPGNPPPVVKRVDNAMVAETRTYQLITPLFGGGVEPQKADPISVVRAPSIRGHLRFWWRAARGGQFGGDLAAMKRAEDAIWGSAAKDGSAGPSKVSLAVHLKDKGEDVQVFEVTLNNQGRPQVRHIGNSQVPAYIAFPLQPKSQEAIAGMKLPGVRKNVRFGLTLRYPEEHKSEIQAALWAWETFGGIGGRTRRGFGALRCVDINNELIDQPAANDIQRMLRTQLEQHVVGNDWPADVPHLTVTMPIKVITRNDAGEAWRALIDQLRDFRQARSGNPGRSRWPEPDEIRNLTKRSSPGHGIPVHNPPIHKFPRARFGLPIIFHFKDRGSGDPNDTTLQSRDHQRFASRLILRPLACANGQACGIAIILQGPVQPPGGLVLVNNRATFPVDAKVDHVEAKLIFPLQGKPNVLVAFLESIS